MNTWGCRLVLVGMLGLLMAAPSAMGQAADQPDKPGGALTLITAGSATVKDVNPEKKTVTIETQDGKTATIKCTENTINFDKLKAGDQIRAVAIERLAVCAGKPGSPKADAAAMMTPMPKGERGFIVADTTDVTDKIDAVDAANHTVTMD